ncbi:sugar kinase [Flavobacterium sp.]|uniref:sugar kinase n=1 Tax=Flavobacterium sp. TaxID=239 RepID=UPI0011FC9178|nr:sugar kinase [Flavobacterium sp.]RZJ73832.1 MAG: sugar kinase [Flavobacterium sp.]
MGKIVTFGEIIMRLSPANHRKMKQSNALEFFFGGTELNVAASLSNLGLKVEHISAVSDDFVGQAALSCVKSYGIPTDEIQINDSPLGLYFLETGVGLRAGQIAYNRLHGSFANLNPEEIDWSQVLKNADWLHWTGISPAISENAYQALKSGLRKASELGISISADPAYRKNLWKYGRDGREVLSELVGFSTIFIGGPNEINEILGTDFSSDKDGFVAAAEALKKAKPSIEKVFDKIRIGKTASHQSVQGRAFIGSKYLETQPIEITDVVDRIGTGDAFAAGLIFGLHNFDDQKALGFANAACAIKHSILGDVNLASADEIHEVARGDYGGRIKR